MKLFTHVEGRDAGKIAFYGLSTCGWCRRTRQLLDKLGVAYDYVYIDLLEPAEQKKAMAEVERWNPSESFPTIVINDEFCIQGFDEQKIRQAVGK